MKLRLLLFLIFSASCSAFLENITIFLLDKESAIVSAKKDKKTLSFKFNKQSFALDDQQSEISLSHLSKAESHQLIQAIRDAQNKKKLELCATKLNLNTKRIANE